MRTETSTVDWDRFKAMARENWERTAHGWHCRLHNTHFHLEGPDGEPCWQCHNQCEITEVMELNEETGEAKFYRYKE